MMKNNTLFLNAILAVILGAVSLGACLVRVFAPVVILREPQIPELVLLSLLALLADHYRKPDTGRDYLWIFVLAAVSFGILPWAAGFVSGMQILKLALCGGVVFTAVTWLFTSMQERMRSGSGCALTPVVCALCLYLAAQCFAGIIL